jgi:hypothetical protein
VMPTNGPRASTSQCVFFGPLLQRLSSSFVFIRSLCPSLGPVARRLAHEVYIKVLRRAEEMGEMGKVVVFL